MEKSKNKCTFANHIGNTFIKFFVSKFYLLVLQLPKNIPYFFTF